MVFSISIRQTTSLTGRADSSANPPPQGTILRFLKLFVCFYQPGILSTLNILYFSLLSNTADFLHPACLVERSGIMPRIFKKKKKITDTDNRQKKKNQCVGKSCYVWWKTEQSLALCSHM